MVATAHRTSRRWTILAAYRPPWALQRRPADLNQPEGARYVATLLEALTCHIAHIVERRDAEQVRLIGQLPPSRSTGPDFDAVLRQIDRRLADKLSLQDLADHAGVCRSVFAEQFAVQFGCSAHRFITERRIERAKQLLIEGRLSVTDIAYEVGFSGQSHFSTAFRASTGTAPTSFARQSRRSDCTASGLS